MLGVESHQQHSSQDMASGQLHAGRVNRGAKEALLHSVVSVLRVCTLKHRRTSTPACLLQADSGRGFVSGRGTHLGKRHIPLRTMPKREKSASAGLCRASARECVSLHSMTCAPSPRIVNVYSTEERAHWLSSPAESMALWAD